MRSTEFEDLNEAYQQLRIEAESIRARVKHHRKSLEALRIRKQNSRSTLHIDKQMKECSSNLNVERAQLEVLDELLATIAKEIGELGEF